ncbi:MAG: hypothetical protein JWR16_1286 [Nevskia sp.]|nr:hypothetical protein [Nevskia sp.]
MEMSTSKLRLNLWLGAGLLAAATSVFAQDGTTAAATADTSSPAADASSTPAPSADTAATDSAASTDASSAPSEPASVSDSGSSSSTSSGGGFLRGLMPEFDFNIGGFLRPEVAMSTRDADDPDNERGNVYNGVTVTRHVGDPFTNYGPILPNSALLQNPILGPILKLIPVVNGQIPLVNNVTRPIPVSNNVFNYHVLRAELELGLKFTSDLSLTARLRAIGDPGNYSDFNAASVNNLQGGISGGLPEIYGGAPNLFQYHVQGSKHPNPLEWAGPNYMVYFPALFLDYNHGPLDIRVGNQQIAWGQAIFFRVLDVPDGLDLRRHSILDFASEEFSDKRVPAPAVRINYQINDDILADAYVQKFQPTVFGNPNTSYNVIPDQFTVQDMYHTDGDDKWNKLSYGLRLRGTFGQFGAQLIAVRRYNPDGVFRWTKSNVNKDLPNDNPLGIVENTLNNGVTPNPLGGGYPAGTTGELLANSAFEASPGGVYSADEWFHYAARVRLNGITGLNKGITDFPSTASLLARPAANFGAAHNELDTFFTAAGGSLRGHVAREYFQETNLGGGVSYVTEGTPGSILDQLIINIEATYTPTRVFTSPDLGKDFLKEDNIVSALVLEKYQRFSQNFPATYMVLQYMHRTHDDLVGRSLKGYGGKDSYSDDTTSATPGLKGGSNYVVFAFQQPFPNLVWRADFAMLYDPEGGILVQPAIRWKPNGTYTVEAFYNYLNGRLGSNPNNNLISTLDFANEVTVRFSYQF